MTVTCLFRSRSEPTNCFSAIRLYRDITCLPFILPDYSPNMPACPPTYLAYNLLQACCLELKFAFLFSCLSCPLILSYHFLTKFFSVLFSSSSLVFFLFTFFLLHPFLFCVLSCIFYGTYVLTVLNKCEIKFNFNYLQRSSCYFCCCSKRIPCSTYLHVAL